MGEDDNKLTGRIYPTILSCVNNRYIILLGIFAFYSFILTTEVKSISEKLRDIQLYGSITFSVIIIFNSLNYFVNSAEQFKIENKNHVDDCKQWIKRNKMELGFLILSNFIIWFAFCVI